VGNGYVYDFVPVADNGYEFRYVMKVVGTDIHRCYPWIVYPLPSLVATDVDDVVFHPSLLISWAG
jgi:hypothetical protein